MNEFEDQGFNVLVVGSGAREAALALALSSDQSVRNIYVTPGKICGPLSPTDGLICCYFYLSLSGNCGINDQVLAPKVKSVGLDLDPCHSGLIKFCKDNEVGYPATSSFFLISHAFFLDKPSCART